MGFQFRHKNTRNSHFGPPDDLFTGVGYYYFYGDSDMNVNEIPISVIIY